jgi:hypothetical protein
MISQAGGGYVWYKLVYIYDVRVGILGGGNNKASAVFGMGWEGFKYIRPVSNGK